MNIIVYDSYGFRAICNKDLDQIYDFFRFLSEAPVALEHYPSQIIRSM